MLNGANRRIDDSPHGELVILTGMSGSGKASALKAFEDLGYYSVDNLPLELIPRFADLVRSPPKSTAPRWSSTCAKASGSIAFRPSSSKVRKVLPTRVVFLEASDDALVRRFSETRRPHPMGREETVLDAIQAERQRLDPIRNVADIVLETTRFNVHELRAHINAQFEERGSTERNLDHFRHELRLQERCAHGRRPCLRRALPAQPHFVPEFRELTGKNPKVAQYVQSFPQTEEFLDKTTDMLEFLLPHYIKEGKSYLTVAFGCTGGQHRSVFIAEEMKRRLDQAGYRAKANHRDMPR